jgi:nucleoside-diphosphate-sugar epimerase
VQRLLSEGHDVLALDDLSNGREENVREFFEHPHFLGLARGDLKDRRVLDAVFSKWAWDSVFHLGASIHVQKSIDDPETTFANDVEGSFRVLEAARAQYFALNNLDTRAKQFDYEKDVSRLADRRPRVAVMSTCMVYDASHGEPIEETHPQIPTSPYAAAKIAADHLAIAYARAYRMPVTVVRPFNTYGPFQKSNAEGGVVSIFLKRDIAGEPLFVKGSGNQTRDLLYVEDCADFVVRAAFETQAEAEIINAGTGRDIAVKDLAEFCRTRENRIEFVAHDHPQAEIMRLCSDSTKAKRLIGWEARTPIEEGLRRTRLWLMENQWAW